MYRLHSKKINIDAPITVDGIQYPNLRDPALRALLGVVEVPDPVYPDPDQFFWTENEDGSLNITPRDPADVAAIAARKQLAIDDQADLDEVKTIPFVNFLVTHRPAQIANKIHNDLASDGVETVLIKLAKALAILAKNKLRS